MATYPNTRLSTMRLVEGAAYELGAVLLDSQSLGCAPLLTLITTETCTIHDKRYADQTRRLYQ